MARKLSEAIDDIQMIAEMFGFDISQLEQFKAAARIEMHYEINKLLFNS